MKYDELLVELGEFGRYQKFQYCLICLISITSSWHSMNMVFVGPTPDHHCAPPDPAPPQWDNLTDVQVLNLTVPYDDDGEPERCDEYNVTGVDWTVGNYTTWRTRNHTEQSCSSGWTYSQEYYTTTIVSEWDLVCTNSYQRSMASTIFFAGRLVGALLCGEISDKIGRRPVFFVSVSAQVVVGCVVAASPNLIFFYVFYFLQGLFQVAVYLSTYVLGMEVVGPKYRGDAGMWVNIVYAVGQMLLAGIAFGIREWRLIEVAITLPVLIYFSYYWLIPESIRWLLTKGRAAEAEVIILRSARWNKVDLPDDIMDQLEVETKDDHVYSVLDILREWKYAKIAINVWFSWAINAMVYYGLSLNTENLAGDPYLNFFISACVEIPGVLIVIFILNKTGRRWLTCVFMLIGGVGCIASAFVPYGWPATTCAMIGKFAISASYAIIYVVAAEVFPTVVRNSAMGFASASARVGGMLAPQILLLGELWAPLPLTTFGLMSVLGAGLVLLLPETTGRPLAQTFQEMDQEILQTPTPTGVIASSFDNGPVKQTPDSVHQGAQNNKHGGAEATNGLSNASFHKDLSETYL